MSVLSAGSCGLFGFVCLRVLRSCILHRMLSGRGWCVCLMFPFGMNILSAVWIVSVISLFSWCGFRCSVMMLSSSVSM